MLLYVVMLQKNISHLFKRDVQYKSLPNLFRKHKPTPLGLDETESRDIGLCALFTPDHNNVWARQSDNNNVRTV